MILRSFPIGYLHRGSYYMSWRGFAEDVCHEGLILMSLAEERLR